LIQLRRGVTMHNPDTYLDQWKRGQELAEAMVPLLGKL
jgi:hypothetical protein